jgi:hypothetical protein
MKPSPNFFRSTRLSTLLALSSLALVASPGCDGNQASQVEGGKILLSLATIPENVNCVRVTVTGAFRDVVSDFDVAPGDSLSQAFTGLPVGSVVFSADAYASACASVTKSTIPMWVSEDETVNVAQGRSSSVTLTLYKNGRAKVTVEFADQEDGGTDSGSTGGSADGGTSGGG